MKKILTLAVMAAIVISAVPLFTATGYAADEGRSGGKSLFQQWANYINTPIEMEVKPMKEINTFQDLSTGIKEGSEKAKHMSLRTPKTDK